MGVSSTSLMVTATSLSLTIGMTWAPMSSSSSLIIGVWCASQWTTGVIIIVYSESHQPFPHDFPRKFEKKNDRVLWERRKKKIINGRSKMIGFLTFYFYILLGNLKKTWKHVGFQLRKKKKKICLGKPARWKKLSGLFKNKKTKKWAGLAPSFYWFSSLL